jgi:hypothetical protein
MNEMFGTSRPPRSSGPFKHGDPIDHIGQLGKKKGTHRIPLHNLSDAPQLQNFFICSKEVLASKPTLGKNIITGNGHGQLYLEPEGPWIASEEAREHADPSTAYIAFNNLMALVELTERDAENEISVIELAAETAKHETRRKRLEAEITRENAASAAPSSGRALGVPRPDAASSDGGGREPEQ